jgi:hypothetical protein
VEGPALQEPMRRRSRHHPSQRRRPDHLALGMLISPTIPPQRPVVGGSFAFMSVVDGAPRRYPADEPIPVYVRKGVGPEDAYSMVTHAFQLVANVTGHDFIFSGTIDQLDEIDEANGRIWVAFVEPQEGTNVAGSVLGHGGVLTLDSTIVGGHVVVSNDEDANPGFGPGHAVGSVLLHELCHAMNLGDVDVQAELMYPFATTLAHVHFGPGDLLGLWLVGSGRGA